MVSVAVFSSFFWISLTSYQVILLSDIDRYCFCICMMSMAVVSVCFSSLAWISSILRLTYISLNQHNTYMNTCSSWGFGIFLTYFSISPYRIGSSYSCQCLWAFYSSAILPLILPSCLAIASWLVSMSLARSLSAFFSLFLRLNMLLPLIYYNHRVMETNTINMDFLESLSPPTSFPPSEAALTSQIENKFLHECERFISNERILYKCSKTIENRLERILANSVDIKDKLSTHKEQLEFIARELEKGEKEEVAAVEREKVLRMLCELIRMEALRKDLLLEDGQKKQDGLGQVTYEIVDEEVYLRKVDNLSQIVRESQDIAYLTADFPLVGQILAELKSIFNETMALITAKLLTPKMVRLILSEHYSTFFGEEDSPMHAAMLNNRINYFKISLNPMLNNLNYATNIPQLYRAILTTWQGLIVEQVEMFRQCGREDMVREAVNRVTPKLVGKMEKNVFRLKQLLAVVKIRGYFSDFVTSVSKEAVWLGEDKNASLDCIKGVIAKCEAVIESKLTESSEALENSKYNIHSLTSYIPIRQHLQIVKECHEHALQNDSMEWEAPFLSLAASRDPKNYPNNKSLLIFNLNIWYLYLKLLPQGRARKEGQQVMDWSVKTYTSINVQETNKKYFESLEKVLELCGNIPAFKSVLYAELQLLGHDQLRREVAGSIRARYVDYYRTLLVKLEKGPMTHEGVKALCQSKKINLNIFGKHSHAICILAPEALEELLTY